MVELLTIFSIGIALSMDAFSLSLGIGTFNISNKKALLLSSIVGVMHFIMPFLGVILGAKLINIFSLDSNFLLGMILVAISIEMLFDLLKKEEKSINMSFLGMFLFAFGVSLDSFSTGIGLTAITNSIFMAMAIFTICSFSFTFMGLTIGKYTNKLLGVYSSLIGSVLLMGIGLFYIFS